MGNRSRRYKSRSVPIVKPVAFRTLGAIRSLMSKSVLPVYDDPEGKPYEIMCDTREIAEAAKQKTIEFDREEFERDRWRDDRNA